MCNVSRGVYDKGMDRGITLGMDKGMALGRKEGITLGMDNSTIAAIKNIMQSLNVSSDRAMDILKVPDEKREYYKSQISSD